MTKQSIPQALLPWIEARRKYHLSHAQIQMARALGMNLKKLGKLANHRQEPWKLPLPRFIESLYVKRFGVARPAEVLSLEDIVAREPAKKAQRREARQQKSAESALSNPPQG